MRLIDYDKAIDRYYAEYEKQDICDGMEGTAWLKRCFEEAPTIDAVPVVHGRWEDIGNDWFDLWRCSACGAEWSFSYDPTSTETRVNFCPDCGARMDGDTNGQA